jgi:hypothetical protein
VLAWEKTRNFAYRQGMSQWLWAMVLGTYDFAHSVRRRWRLYRMQWLDDQILDDIGVTREELEWALRLPLRANAALALHDRAKQRRHSTAAAVGRW